MVGIEQEFGGLGGDGGSVTFARLGDTFTSGASSNGITVQSIGGGGGMGEINISGGIAATKGNAGSVGFGLGGFGGDGGTGGDVTATVYGNVIATGLESDTTVPVFDLSLLEGTQTEDDYSDLVMGEHSASAAADRPAYLSNRSVAAAAPAA